MTYRLYGCIPQHYQQISKTSKGHPKQHIHHLSFSLLHLRQHQISMSMQYYPDTELIMYVCIIAIFFKSEKHLKHYGTPEQEREIECF